MVEQLGFLKLLEMFSQFGLAGVILVIWYKSDRSRERSQQSYQNTIREILDQYQQDMGEQRRMYENNVELVRSYQGLATDLKDVVIMNTQSMMHLGEAITHNQFCPMVRLKKDARGPVEDS